MANQISIYCIHASDAPQHLGRIQQLAQKFKDQKRISNYVTLSPEETKASLQEKVSPDDIVILLLTVGLEPRQKEIEDILSDIKQNVTIAEIIIDNIRYENEYITLPTDLKPIRNREDMDKAWLAIEEDLDKLVPKKTVTWKKFIIPATAVAIIGLLAWLAPKMFNRSLDFTYNIIDLKSSKLLSDTACYLPCLVSFTTEIKSSDSVLWDFGDSLTSKDPKPTHLYITPGRHNITLTALNRNKDVSKKISVKSPPIADFQIDGNGCTAPCKIDFKNNSGPGKSFFWKFSGINQTSQEENPTQVYNTPGKYSVTFNMVNEDNMPSDTVTKQISIQGDNSPFAMFSTSSGGRFHNSTKVKFTNQSKNADAYVWNFGDNSTISHDVSPTHLYSKAGSYTVELTAKKGNITNRTSKTISVGRYILDYALEMQVQKIEDPKLKQKVLQDIKYQKKYFRVQ